MKRVIELKLPIAQEGVVLQPGLHVCAVALDPADLSTDSVEALFDGAVEALIVMVSMKNR